jgi:predicted RNA methylase
MSKQQQEMTIISELLDQACEKGLEVEVIYKSLQIMREDDVISPSQAFQDAIDSFLF